ncbi:MAG: hypothetical protein R3B06_23805 [Kofleriaceae bacterium]
MQTRSLLTRLLLGAALATSLSACTVRGHAWVSTPGVVVVEERPPPPRREVVVVRPGYIWVDGHWDRRGNRWLWVDGHHERARANAQWVPGRWEARGRGHVWIKGTWKSHDDRGRRENRGRARVQDHR